VIDERMGVIRLKGEGALEINIGTFRNGRGRATAARDRQAERFKKAMKTHRNAPIRKCCAITQEGRKLRENALGRAFGAST
jgi:hypothetical protein